MAWFYNSHSGQVIQDDNLLTEWGDVLRTKLGAGWHEYGSQAQMDAAIKANNWPPATSSVNPGAVLAGTGQAAVENATHTTGWTHNIEQWVIRAFEMLLGAALIVVALAKIAGDTPVGKAAVKAGKVAAIL